MWGTVDTAKENAVDMKMGLPASTLRRLGAKEIEDDFTYQIEVGGTAQAPEVNFLRLAFSLPQNDFPMKPTSIRVMVIAISKDCPVLCLFSHTRVKSFTNWLLSISLAALSMDL